MRRIGNAAASYVLIDGVHVPARGSYVIDLDYLLKGERTFFVSVNGGPGLEVPLSGTSWTEPTTATVTVPLHAGRNAVKIYNDMSYGPDLDRIVVRPAPR